MKNLLNALAICLLIFSTSSCKKDEKGSEADVQLTKITNWNPSTGAETTKLELTYNSSGVLSSAKGSNNDNYALTYDAAGKLTKVVQSNPNGRSFTSQLEYNPAGKVSKVNGAQESSGSAAFLSSSIYEYNAAGKIIKKVTTYPGGSSTAEFTWIGDNISEVKNTTSPGSFLTTTKYTYDDKKNPYTLGGDAMTFVFFDGEPASKNNALEISRTNSNGTALKKRSFEYSTTGFATSMKLLDGSNEGQKFYYNK